MLVFSVKMAENEVFWGILPTYKEKSKETTRVIFSRNIFGGHHVYYQNSLSLAKGEQFSPTVYSKSYMSSCSQVQLATNFPIENL